MWVLRACVLLLIDLKSEMIVLYQVVCVGILLLEHKVTQVLGVGVIIK